jgi:hypothetical protein
MGTHFLESIEGVMNQNIKIKSKLLRATHFLKTIEEGTN